jgi:hypothetical protein
MKSRLDPWRKEKAIAMTSGRFRAFFALGGMTLLSTIVFRELKRGDDDPVSHGRSYTPG